MTTNLDRCAALKAIEQKVAEERKMLEYECRDELLAAYREEGTDRRTSPLFGPEAGKYSVKRMKGEPEREEVSFSLEDDEAFADWLEDNRQAAFRFAMLHATELAEWWMDGSGEVPDGIGRQATLMPATDGSVSAQWYSFKPDVVLAKLAEMSDAGSFLEGANRLLLEGEVA